MARFNVRPVIREGLSSTPGDAQPEGASETFLKGALLVDDGSGRLQEGAADPTDIVGVADEDGENNASEGAVNVHFTPVSRNIIFEGSIDDNGDLGNGVSALAQVHQKYGITQDADGVWYVDIGKTAANLQRVEIMGLKDSAGTINGRVYFKFL